MKTYFIVLFALVLFLVICACTNSPSSSQLSTECKGKVISEKYDNKNQSLRFSATPTTSEKLIFTNSTGDLTSYTMNESFTNGIPLKNWTIYEDASSDLCFKKNDGSSTFCMSSSPNNSSIKIGSTVVDETYLKKQNHWSMIAGWAVDLTRVFAPIYVGSHSFIDSYIALATQDTLDAVLVNKGFKITMYDGLYEGAKAEFQNTDSDVPKLFWLLPYSLNDRCSSVKAEWIGY